MSISDRYFIDALQNEQNEKKNRRRGRRGESHRRCSSTGPQEGGIVLQFITDEHSKMLLSIRDFRRYAHRYERRTTGAAVVNKHRTAYGI